jgi:predicted RNA methylase
MTDLTVVTANPDLPPRVSGLADLLRSELLTERSTELADLALVRKAGRLFFGHPEGMSLYDRRPAQWYAEGFRIVRRTVVEASVDASASRIARSVGRILRHEGIAPSEHTTVVDLFAGSGNLGLHVAANLSASFAGVERNPGVYRCTANNMSLLGMRQSALVNGEWFTYAAQSDGDEVFVVAPPWGDAFSFIDGLDLNRTDPPVLDILHWISRNSRSRQSVAVVQVPVSAPLREASFDRIRRHHRLLGRAPGCAVFQISRTD